ncbi:MAG: SMC family ATPase [Chloroflexi bacterium]|nr:SMC family ATPase [Chloroflexota bacterium]
MIPLKLELTNFLSYRDTAVLQFDGIHLACISGANGAGKSSILDGMTYALFGKSRSKSDDDLVNRMAAANGDGAEVRFTFALENTTYRVSRRKRSSKATRLELQIQGENEHWKALTESKVRETQTEIEKLLRMNYDTFINASFLLQGKADEFTTKTANKRKEVLADLLGLNIWDSYKELASARRKEEEGQLFLLDGQLSEIEAELNEAEIRQAALQSAQEGHTAIATRLADKQAILEQMRRIAAAIAQQKKNVQTLAANLTRARHTLTKLQNTHAQREKEQAAYQIIVDQADEIAVAFSAWQKTDNAVQSWQEKGNTYNRLQQAKRPYELTLTQEISRREQRLRELGKQEQAAAAAAAEKETLATTISVNQTQLQTFEESLQALAGQENEYQILRAELQQRQGDLALQQKEVGQLKTRTRQIEKMKKEQTAVSKNLQEAETTLVNVAAEIATLATVNQTYLTKMADRDTLQRWQPNLRQQMKKHKERLDQLSVETGSSCPLCGQPLTADHRQKVLAELKQEGSQMGDEFRENAAQIETLSAEVAALDGRLKAKPKLEQQEQTQRDRKARAVARLDEIEQAAAEWEAEGAKRLVELETAMANQAPIQQLKTEVAELETAVAQKTALEKERHAAQQQIARDEARLTETKRLITVWEDEGQAERTTVQQQLETSDYAPEAQTALADLEAQLTAVAYNETDHQAAITARDTLADAPEKQQQLQQAMAALKPLTDSLADQQQQITEQKSLVADTQQQHDTVVTELEILTQDGGNLNQIEDAVQNLREEEIRANRKVGAAQQRLDVLDDLRRRQTHLHSERSETTLQIQRLKVLEKACGRNGVQALLIEQTLPEIEDRANELLDRLTDGQMRVIFDTQRQLKTRDALAETLDIRIVDNAGERPYSNFSGGEQFRVNFAIRLALSQVLAKRAGARLQTLVVDEGFGSQDPIGRQRLVEAINTIQKDFKVILVITHIDELRDAFPTRIEVEKRPSGSSISIS